jgi:hypothetical protein
MTIQVDFFDINELMEWSINIKEKEINNAKSNEDKEVLKTQKIVLVAAYMTIKKKIINKSL